MENVTSSVSPLPQAGGEGKPGAGYYAARILAQMIDLIIFSGVFYLVGLAMALRVGGLQEGGFNLTGAPALLFMGIVLLIVFLYDWLLEGLFGRTVGKMIFNLKVVRSSGEVCGLGPSLIRNALRIVDGLFFYLVGFIAILTSPKQQRVGDRAAGTFVVKDRSPGTLLLGIILFLVLMAGVGKGVLQMREAVKSGVGLLPAPSAPSSPGSITLRNMRFTEGSGGPPVAKTYGPEDELFLSFDVEGLSLDSAGRSDSHLLFTALDPQGKPLTETVKVEVKGLPPAPPFVVPANFHLTLPSFVEGGTYAVQVDVHDQLTRKEVSQKVPFRVNGPQIPPKSPLGIRDYRFSAEKDGPPLSEAVYPPGATIYSKFLAVGFKFGPENFLKLHLDLTVLSSSGEKLLEKQGIIQVEDRFFYPPSYLTMRTSVNTPSGVPPGHYVIHTVLTDEISGTQASFDAPLTIR